MTHVPPRLVLVPTPLEFDFLRPRLQSAQNVIMDICGFGPVAAAARAGQLIHAYQPGLVLLVGIAGCIGDSLEVGRAYQFTQAAMYGVGAGTGDSFIRAGELGWSQWWSGNHHGGRLPEQIGDVIAFCRPQPDHGLPDRQLLTCCAASSTKADIRGRLRTFPEAVAEDMEGYSVAIAAQLCGRPLRIVRGISNRAGDRHKARWKVHDALHAAAEMTLEVLK
ncbi:MAG: hypothetical protein KDA81_14395 [Planctomycetaceae bacterium]|nr:hypothetical protein [Planctomycetaceae bacterium]